MVLLPLHVSDSTAFGPLTVSQPRTMRLSGVLGPTQSRAPRSGWLDFVR
jgi:hypothetical protein